MIDHVRALRDGVATLSRMLSSVTARDINRQSHKDAVRDYVDTYFRTQRRFLKSPGASDDDLAVLDSDFQDLLRLTQRRSHTKEYRSLFGRLHSHLNAFELSALPRAGERDPGAGPQLDRVDGGILKTLDSLCPSAAASYHQALSDLRDPDRVSWRGTAVELREALREVLDTLAPDDEVKAQPGFKLEKDATGPTRKQKVRFVLRARRLSSTAMEAPVEAVEIVEERVGCFVGAVYGRSSVSTHVQTTRDEVVSLKRYVVTALAELLVIRE